MMKKLYFISKTVLTICEKIVCQFSAFRIDCQKFAKDSTSEICNGEIRISPGTPVLFLALFMTEKTTFSCVFQRRLYSASLPKNFT